jgi:DNA invertase Pin-like site-specific DNA recombinase
VLLARGTGSDTTRVSRILLDDLQAVGVAFVSLGEAIDCTTRAGKLQLHILAALAEFERERIRKRVLANLQRARAQGKRLGRPTINPLAERLATVVHLSLTNAAASLGISRATIKAMAPGSQIPSVSRVTFAPIQPAFNA